MEENRVIKRVGGYSTMQAEPEECYKCKDAKFGTVIIDGLCLDCLLAEARKGAEDENDIT